MKYVRSIENTFVKKSNLDLEINDKQGKGILGIEFKKKSNDKWELEECKIILNKSWVAKYTTESKLKNYDKV